MKLPAVLAASCLLVCLLIAGCSSNENGSNRTSTSGDANTANESISTESGIGSLEWVFNDTGNGTKTRATMEVPNSWDAQQGESGTIKISPSDTSGSLKTYIWDYSTDDFESADIAVIYYQMTIGKHIR